MCWLIVCHEAENRRRTRNLEGKQDQTEGVSTDPGKAIRDLLKENDTVESKQRTNRR